MADIRAFLDSALATRLLRWFVGLYVAAGLVAMAGMFAYAELSKRESSDTLVRAMLDNYGMRVETLEARYDEMRAEVAAYAVEPAALERLEQALAVALQLDGTDAVAVERRLDRVERLAVDAEASVRDLVAILSPAPPWELLTVVRLGDRFELYGHELEGLKARIDTLRQDFEARLARDHEHSAARIDDAFLMMQAFMVVVVPVFAIALGIVMGARPGTEGAPAEA